MRLFTLCDKISVGLIYAQNERGEMMKRDTVGYSSLSKKQRKQCDELESEVMSMMNKKIKMKKVEVYGSGVKATFSDGADEYTFCKMDCSIFK